MTAQALAAALTDHFVNPKDPTSGLVLQEVTAPNSARRIDVLAVSLWASRGFGIDAIEIKVDRRDYLREIEEPAKADPWWRHSNRFWIAAPSTAVADPSLLPPGWGLLIPSPNSRRFRAVVKAEERKLDMSWPLFSTIVGRHVNVVQDRAQRKIDDAVRLLRQQQDDKLRAIRDQYASGSDPEVRAALDKMRAVQKAAGVDIDGWAWGNHCTVEEFGTAVRAALDLQRTEEKAKRLADLNDLAADLRQRADRLIQAAATLTGEGVDRG